MRSKTALALVGVALFLAGGAGGGARAAEESRLTAFYTAPVASMAPMWIAKEAGFFKKHGLDVNILFIASGPAGAAALLSGEADVGIIGGSAPVQAILGGADLAIIGQSKKYMVGAIVGRTNLQSVHDLRGKRLGIDRIGSNPDMYTMAALARFNIDPRRDLTYVQLGDTGQGIAALKAGAIDALTTTPPHNLFAQRLGYKVILDITALKLPFAATVLASARSTVDRKPAELRKFMRGYAEAIHYFLKNPEGTAQIVARYTKVQDMEIVAHGIEAESQAMERTLQVEPRGIEFVLEQLKGKTPQAASAKAQDFYDARFFTELRESGFLTGLWREN